MFVCVGSANSDYEEIDDREYHMPTHYSWVMD